MPGRTSIHASGWALFCYLNFDGGTELLAQAAPERFVVNKGVVELLPREVEDLDVHTSNPKAWRRGTDLSLPAR